MRIFIFILFVILFVILCKCRYHMRGGDKKGGIISIEGRHIHPESDIPLPTTIVMTDPRKDKEIILRGPTGYLPKGSNGVVGIYSSGSKEYVIKSMTKVTWQKERDLWNMLGPYRKGAFVETYFGSPDIWLIPPQQPTPPRPLSIHTDITETSAPPPPPLPIDGGMDTPPRRPNPNIHTPMHTPHRWEESMLVPINDYGIIVTKT